MHYDRYITSTATKGKKMSETKTIAQRIADMFDNDGRRFELDDGTTFDDVCGEHDVVTCCALDEGGTKWTFADDSILVSFGDGWDIGLSHDCSCVVGTGHDDDYCEAHSA